MTHHYHEAMRQLYCSPTRMHRDTLSVTASIRSANVDSLAEVASGWIATSNDQHDVAYDSTHIAPLQEHDRD